MYPELFSIGNLTIHSYGLMIAIGVLVAAVLTYREAPKENLNPDHVLESVVATMVAGLLGARLLYVMLNWDYYRVNLTEIFFAQFEGLSFYGGFLLGVLVLLLWSSWRKTGFLKMADLLAPYLALGYAFGRIGCFLNGCCYGRESDLPWAMPASMADDVLRHPVQLYAAILAVLIFVILKQLRPRRPFVGFMLIAFFGFYGLLRFTTEFFRYEEAVWLGLTQAQIFSLGTVIAALAVFAVFTLVLPEDTKQKNKNGPAKKERKDGKKSDEQ